MASPSATAKSAPPGFSVHREGKAEILLLAETEHETPSSSSKKKQNNAGGGADDKDAAGGPSASDPRSLLLGAGERKQVFINPIQEFNRDVSVVAIRAWSEIFDAEKAEQWERKRKGKGKGKGMGKGKGKHAAQQQEEKEEEEDDRSSHNRNKRRKVDGPAQDRAVDVEEAEGGKAETAETQKDTDNQTEDLGRAISNADDAVMAPQEGESSGANGATTESAGGADLEPALPSIDATRPAEPGKVRLQKMTPDPDTSHCLMQDANFRSADGTSTSIYPPPAWNRAGRRQHTYTYTYTPSLPVYALRRTVGHWAPLHSIREGDPVVEVREEAFRRSWVDPVHARTNTHTPPDAGWDTPLRGMSAKDATSIFFFQRPARRKGGAPADFTASPRHHSIISFHVH